MSHLFLYPTVVVDHEFTLSMVLRVIISDVREENGKMEKVWVQLIYFSRVDDGEGAS